MTYNRQDFHTFAEEQTVTEVVVANNERLPGIKRRLFSASKTIALGNKIILDDESKLILQPGKEVALMRHMSWLVLIGAVKTRGEALVTTTSQSIWHRRLGHASSERLRQAWEVAQAGPEHKASHASDVSRGAGTF